MCKSSYRIPDIEVVCAIKSPILDMSGHLETISPLALRTEPKHLEWFADKSLGGVVTGKWENLQICHVVLSKLKDGGVIVADSIDDDVIERIKTLDYKVRVRRGNGYVMIQKLSGKKGVESVTDCHRLPKTACIIRYGAIGDMVMLMPLIDKLKAEGYHVTLNTTRKGSEVFSGDPRVDRMMSQEDGFIHGPDLVDYWRMWDDRFDLIVNVSGRIETSLLPIDGEPAFEWDYAKRERSCNRPYFDEHLRVAGFEAEKPQKGFIWLSDSERKWAEREAENIKRELRVEKLIAWHPLGSSQHKAYPWAFDIFTLMRATGDKSFGFVALGDKVSEHLVGMEFRDIVCNKCGKYTIRQSMAIHSVVDAVLTPETWGLCASFAFDAPVVALLSHSSVEQWPFQSCDRPMAPDRMLCVCYPCHRIHKSRTTCPYGVHERSATLCMDSIPPDMVYNALTTIIASGARRE